MKFSEKIETSSSRVITFFLWAYSAKNNLTRPGCQDPPVVALCVKSRPVTLFRNPHFWTPLGTTIGLWRGWEMAAYVSIKFPAAVLLTLLVNGLLNGMLGLVLGSGIGFRQSLQFLLAGFAIMALILGALSPVTFFLALNTPPADHPDAGSWHALTLLTHTLAIALAGILSHRKLLSFLREFAQTRLAGIQTFFAWLAGNLFVGAQITWILRPFFGSPGLEVQFLRPDPFEGSFYDAVINSALRLLGI